MLRASRRVAHLWARTTLTHHENGTNYLPDRRTRSMVFTHHAYRESQFRQALLCEALCARATLSLCGQHRLGVVITFFASSRKRSKRFVGLFRFYHNGIYLFIELQMANVRSDSSGFGQWWLNLPTPTSNGLEGSGRNRPKCVRSC